MNQKRVLPVSFAVVFSLLVGSTSFAENRLERVALSEDGTHFVLSDQGTTFRPWGVNYDHRDSDSALLEDYWEREWHVVEEDFQEIVDLGANSVRIHLQTGRFMEAPGKPNEANLKRLQKLLRLAEETGLYLNLTGLGCYHEQDVPEWFDALGESDRWKVQEQFWEAIARTCRSSPAVFCYDLMNEPVLPGPDKVETDWLAGELGGKHFVQRLSLDLAGRDRKAVAKAWVEKMTSAIRRHDEEALITVGVIPWVFVFGGGAPFFHSESVGESLDFVAVHFYPKSGEIDKAVAALQAYDVGKPLVVEEVFPLHCSPDELAQFMSETSDVVDGWFSFYWGTSEQEYKTKENPTFADGLKGNWMKRFRELLEEL